MAGLTREQRAQRAAEKSAKEAVEKAEADQSGVVSVAPGDDAAASTQGAADADAAAAMPLARDGDGKLSAATEEPDLTGLVLMVKDGETLPVHPTCVRAHVNAGWKAVE